jgi:hypothetical protein
MKRFFVISGCTLLLGVFAAKSFDPEACVKGCNESYSACMANTHVKDNPQRESELKKDCSARLASCKQGCGVGRKPPGQ